MNEWKLFFFTYVTSLPSPSFLPASSLPLLPFLACLRHGNHRKLDFVIEVFLPNCLEHTGIHHLSTQIPNLKCCMLSLKFKRQAHYKSMVIISHPHSDDSFSMQPLRELAQHVPNPNISDVAYRLVLLVAWQCYYSFSFYCQQCWPVLLCQRSWTFCTWR